MDKSDSGISGARSNGLEASSGIKLNGTIVVKFVDEETTENEEFDNESSE